MSLTSSVPPLIVTIPSSRNRLGDPLNVNEGKTGGVAKVFVGYGCAETIVRYEADRLCSQMQLTQQVIESFEGIPSP